MKIEELRNCHKYVLETIKKYRFAYVVLLIGVVLMTLSKRQINEQETKVIQEDQWTLEAEMEQLLQHVDGAGMVKVLLSEKTGPVCTYQENVTVFSGEKETERKTETVLLSTSSGETPIQLQTIYPTYQGAVVIAEGADRPSVKLNLIRAVSSLTGLSSDQITVIKMN